MSDILDQLQKRLVELRAERERVLADLVKRANDQIAYELRPYDTTIAELEKLLPKVEPAGDTNGG